MKGFFIIVLAIVSLASPVQAFPFSYGHVYGNYNYQIGVIYSPGNYNSDRWNVSFDLINTGMTDVYVDRSSSIIFNGLDATADPISLITTSELGDTFSAYYLPAGVFDTRSFTTMVTLNSRVDDFTAGLVIAPAIAHAVVVPEPTTLGVLAVGAIGLIKRPKRS